MTDVFGEGASRCACSREAGEERVEGRKTGFSIQEMLQIRDDASVHAWCDCRRANEGDPR